MKVPTHRFALCLARSYDPIAVHSEYPHILYSAYKFPLGEDFNSSEFIKNLYPSQAYFLNNEDFKKRRKLVNRIFYIFRVKAFDLNLDSDMSLADRFIKEILIEKTNYGLHNLGNGVMEISLPFITLLSEQSIYNNDDDENVFNLLERIIGKNSDESKNYGEWLSHSIFIFEGFTTLYTIIELFKSFNIHLSPGGIPSRGALSTIQANLHTFLLLSKNLFPFANKSVFESYEYIAISKKIAAQNKMATKKSDKLHNDITKTSRQYNYNFAELEVSYFGVI